MRHATAIVLLAAMFCGPAYAWSNKEHIQLTRIAALRLVNSPDTPAEMKQWLRDAMPGMTDMEGERQYFLTARVGRYPAGAQGLSWWATVPDLDVATGRNGPQARKVEPFGVSERPLHFIDAEFFNPDESKRVYAHDLSTKPKLADFPRDMSDPRYERAGMLPFRVEQCYGELVKSIRAGRLLDKPGQFPRDEHATKWAGFLAHYVQDNTQPQHATIDFKSQSYFKNPGRAPNVHADVEYRLVDDEHADYPALRAALAQSFAEALETVKDPATSDDLWVATLEVSLHSYDALPLIGKAALAAYGPDGKGDFDADAFFRTKGTFAGRETTVLDMKARQLALAVRRVEALWLRAWTEAHAKPPEAPAATGG